MYPSAGQTGVQTALPMERSFILVAVLARHYGTDRVRSAALRVAGTGHHWSASCMIRCGLYRVSASGQDRNRVSAPC